MTPDHDANGQLPDDAVKSSTEKERAASSWNSLHEDESGTIAQGIMPGTFYHGDNLDVLRELVPNDCVDLIYLDPPFNSKRVYNEVFGRGRQAQQQIFTDIWSWDDKAIATYDELVEKGSTRVPPKLASIVRALHDGLYPERRDDLAYVVMMAIRLIELHRVLKDTGSLYLHCDPTASHYLRLMLDAVFDGDQSRGGGFKSEIVWRRTGAHGKARRYGPVHDTILFYAKTDKFTWNYPKRPYMRGHVDEFFVKEGDKWRTDYYGNVLTGHGTRGGESGKEWKGVNPTAKGRHWAIPGKLVDEYEMETGEDISELSQHEKLDRLFDAGFITITPGEAWPMYQHDITPNSGTPLSDIWAFQPYTGGTVFGREDGIDADIRWLPTKDRERLGYPTQKPLALLNRIIEASSRKGNLVLDPFCGCGTTVESAERLERQWLGIDVSEAAIEKIRERFKKAEMSVDVKEEVEPFDEASARRCFDLDEHKFQWWAARKIGGHQVGGKQKKGADDGIDGEMLIEEYDEEHRKRRVILSVKGGGRTNPNWVRDLQGVVSNDRHRAHMGVLIMREEPSPAMKRTARESGTVPATLPGEKDPAKIQILTIAGIFRGERPDLPGRNITEKAAPQVFQPQQMALPLDQKAKPSRAKKEPPAVSVKEIIPKLAKTSEEQMKKREIAAEVPEPQKAAVAERRSVPPPSSRR